jgi:hypothetical protein
MGFKNQILITIVGISLLLFHSACEKKCTKHYYPIVPINIIAKADTIELTDSIIVYANQANYYQDFYTNEYTNFSNYDLKLSLYTLEYYNTNKNILEESNKLTYAFDINKNGNLKPINESTLIEYPLINDSMNFYLNLKPIKKGLFSICFNSLIHSRLVKKEKITNSECDEKFEGIMAKINNGNINKNLTAQYDTSYFPVGKTSQYTFFENNSCFYIYVK